MNKIKAQNIWKKFNKLEVLKGIDLEVNEGEVVAVIGPSGGGKSTLLRCLNKLETIDKGSVIIDGEALCKETAVGLTSQLWQGRRGAADALQAPL